MSSTIYSPGLSRDSAKATPIEILDRRSNLRFGVHYKRPIAGYRFVDGFAAQKQQLRIAICFQ
jgi:hypothetical protein